MTATPNSRLDDPALMATARGTPDPSVVNDASLRDQIARAEIRSRMFGGHAPTIGRYTVLHPLGSGGMGTVFAAYDDRLDRRIAIKVLHHAGAEAGDLLLAEARALARVRHPNVVAVHDVGDDQDRVYIAMEYVEGGDLRRWLSDEPTWRKALDVLVQAGRGLAAAHESGVLHRDFKPENAILTPDGKVHVVDFGLALAPRPGSAREPQSGEHLPTHTGEFAGTPGYMPLEQLRRGRVDERSDQFAFCVTLYEAVYGSRPFRGGDVETMIEAVERGIESAPEHPDAPRWLAGIILRGLATDPDARWPSMQALLDALERRRHPVRHRWWVGLAFLTGGGVVAAASMDDDHCAGASETIEADFSDAARARVAEAFASAAPAYGADAWNRVDAQLEDYAERWSESYRYFCEATHVRGELSADRLDTRMQCLQRRWRQVSALMGVFADADAATVKRASMATETLEAPMTCEADSDANDATRVPADKADAVQALELDLQEAIAVLSVGKYDDGAKLAKDVRTRAAELEWIPTKARASFQVAQGQSRLRQLDEAIEGYREAYFDAHAMSMDSLMAHAAGSLAFSLGSQQQKAPALVWSELEAASLRRLEDVPPEDWHMHHNRRASIYHGAGELDDALAQMSAALDYNAKGTPLSRATTLNNYAVFLYEAGRVEEALEAATEALELHREHNGPDHPMTLDTQQLVMTALHGIRRTEQALEQATDLLERVERGADPDAIGDVLNNRGNMLETLGRTEEALADFDRALEIFEGIDKDGLDVAVVLTGKGLALKHAGRMREALPLQRRSAEIFEAKLPKGHFRLGVALSNLGATLTDSGDPAAAIPVLERAREQMLTNNRAGIALVRLEGNLALALDAVGRPEDALPVLQAAEKRLTAHDTPNRYEIGKVRRNLGLILHALGRNEEAREVLKAALEDLESSPPDALRLAEACRNRAYVEDALGSDKAEVERWVERALHHYEEAPEVTNEAVVFRAWWAERSG